MRTMPLPRPRKARWLKHRASGCNAHSTDTMHPSAARHLGETVSHQLATTSTPGHTGQLVTVRNWKSWQRQELTVVAFRDTPGYLYAA